MARVELVELGLVGEEWVEAGHLAALHVAQVLERVDDLLERDALVRLAGERRARGHEQVCVLGDDAVLLVEVERHVEAVAQLGEVLERAAQEGDVATNGVTAGEARDRLVGHGLEDRGGHVGGRGTFVHQRLDVGLGEHAAAARDGVDVGGLLGELVEAARVGVQQARHLVDERARAAGARAVHALLDAVVEVDDLGILAAQLDGHVGLGDERLHGALGGDDLLDELQVEPLGQQQAA